MEKIWIKPLRNMWLDDETVLHDGKIVELPEEQAQPLLKNGWATFAEKPKNSKPPKEPKRNQAQTLANNAVQTDENDENQESDDGQTQDDVAEKSDDGQTESAPVQGSLTEQGDV